MSDKNRDLLWPSALFLATFALYLFGLRHAGFVWDDDMYVTSNATLRTLDGLRRIWFEPSSLPQYYPLVHTSFWLEFRLWGLAPFGFHAVNAALHAGAAVLLGRVLLRLEVPAAWFSAALWALHPVQVESVAWVTERKNVLSGVFYFAAALCFLRFFRSRDARAYGLGALAFVCALLSKTVTASLPAALLLVLVWKQGRPRRRDLLLLLPLFVLGAGSGLATAWIERHHVGAEGEAWNLTWVERCLIAGRALWFYAGKLAWPANLAFIYPRWRIDAGALSQYIFPLGALATTGALWGFRRRIGTGPLVAVLFFGGTLFPALGFLNVFPMRYSFVADHFQYLAAAGLLALLGAAAANAVPRGHAALAALVLTTLGALTLHQCRVFNDLEALWRDTLAKNPEAWMAHTNLGLMLVQRGQAAEGIAHYQELIRLEPNLIEPRLNLGEILQREGRPDEAVAVLEALVAKWPANPVGRFNLGTALCKRGRFAEAIPHLQEALRLRPEFAEAAYNLGTAYLQLGRTSEAESMYREALRIRPDYGVAHNNLAAVLESSGRKDEARAHRIAGLRLRAWTLATHDDPRNRNGAEAVQFAESACRDTNWSDPRAIDALAAAKAETGQFDEAVRFGEQALALARLTGDETLAEAIARRVAGYRAQRPYRDPATVPRPGAFPARG